MIKSKQFGRGFSILELLITVAIVGLITGVVTLKYGSFNNLILLKNQTYQVALDLREAQAKSLSSVGQGGVFREVYGMYVTTADRNNYTLFVDSDKDGIYSIGEDLETVSLDDRFELASLCNGSDCDLTELSVVFRRPNFDAIIQNGSISTASIKVRSKNDEANERTVVINVTGQISVE